MASFQPARNGVETHTWAKEKGAGVKVGLRLRFASPRECPRLKRRGSRALKTGGAQQDFDKPTQFLFFFLLLFFWGLLFVLCSFSLEQPSDGKRDAKTCQHKITFFGSACGMGEAHQRCARERRQPFPKVSAWLSAFQIEDLV